MIETIVQYLHGAHLPFKLASYPSEEALPLAAHRAPPGAAFVDATPILVNGTAVLACHPVAEEIDLVALGATLGGVAIEAGVEVLPSEFRHAGPIPPLGQLFGLPLVLDERVASASSIVFRAFSESDYIEIPYDDFARVEQPRVVTIARAELPPVKRAS